MTQTAHRLLAKLAANDRRKREQELADLQRRRKQFRDTCDAIARDISRLNAERSHSMGDGAAAARLVAISSAIEEKRAMTIFIEQQIAQLQHEEQHLIRLWTAASVKETVHDKADTNIVRQRQRTINLRNEQQISDLCAASNRVRATVDERE